MTWVLIAILSCPQAVPVKHDIGVPDPFQQGGRPESSLGVSVRPPTTLAAGQSGAQQYTNIAEVGDFTAAQPSGPSHSAPSAAQENGKNVFSMMVHWLNEGRPSSLSLLLHAG